MTDVGKASAGGAAPRTGSNASSDKQLCEIVIQRENDKPVTKVAKRNWENQEHSEITEACVQGLGFSLFDLNGEKRKSLRLQWRPKNRPKTLEDDFFIVPRADHEIVFGMDAFDKWQHTTNPGVYPCFMNKGASDFDLPWALFVLTRSKLTNWLQCPRKHARRGKRWRRSGVNGRAQPKERNGLCVWRKSSGLH